MQRKIVSSISIEIPIREIAWHLVILHNFVKFHRIVGIDFKEQHANEHFKQRSHNSISVNRMEFSNFISSLLQY